MGTNQNQYPKLSESLKRAETKFPELLARDFARILQRVELLWGTKEALIYLDSVFLGDSPARPDRQGFSIEVMNEIVLLKQMHEYLFPSLDTNPYDPFSVYSLAAPAKSNSVPGYGSKVAADKSSAVPQSEAQGFRNEPVEEQTAWPLIRTQRELIEIADRIFSGSSVYEMQGKPVGEILKHYGLIDDKAVQAACQTQEKTDYKDKAFGQILVKVGLIRHDQLIQALCIQAGMLMVDAENIAIPFETLRAVPSVKAREKQVIPVAVYRGTLFLAVANPLKFNDHLLFTKLTGFRIIPVYAPRYEIVNRLNIYK